MLYITPQALSKSIKQLEAEYNCRLFIRKNNNTLTLSHIGQQILCEAKDLLKQYYLIDQHIKQLADMESGYFKIAIAQNALNIIDINLFNSFKETHPKLYPEYIEMPDKIVDEYIESDLADVCFNINALPNSEEYTSILVRSLQVCAIERSRSLIVNHDYVTLRDIADKKIVSKNELY